MEVEFSRGCGPHVYIRGIHLGTATSVRTHNRAGVSERAGGSVMSSNAATVGYTPYYAHVAVCPLEGATPARVYHRATV